MIERIARRIASSLLVLWLVATGTFLLAYAIPADPARAAVGPHANAETIARVRHQMCLDRPLVVQYGCFVGRMARGDLGKSFRTKRPVIELLAERFGPTAQLALAAVTLTVIFGVALGVIGAVKRRRAPEKAVLAVTLLGQSAPTFFVGPLLIYIFAYRLGWFPVTGYGAAGWDRLLHIALPAATLAFGGIAYYARLVRADMIEELDRDYVRTARAKGASERSVILRHALRNALMPVVTLAGLDLGVLLGGAAVTETVFAWPGLGREAVLGVVNLDLPVVLGSVLLVSITISAANVLVDVLYPLLDPRTRAR